MTDQRKKYQSNIPRSPSYIRVRVPNVVQMEMIECGAASLCSILGYYGRHLPLETLRVECGVSRDGVSVYGIVQAAQKNGLLAEAHIVDLEDLYDLPLPLIAFWNCEHFVVIEGFSRNAVYIMDPAVGRTTITYEDLNAAFTGIVILFDPSIDFEKFGQPRSIIDSLVKIVKKEYVSFLFAFLAGLCLVLPQLALPAFAQIFIDNILIGHIFNWVDWFIISLFVIIFLMFMMKYVELKILSRLYIKLTTEASGQFLWHILRLPFVFYLQRQRGEIANRMSLNENVYKTIATQLSGLVIDAVVAVIFGIALFYYDIWIALIGLSMVFANLIFMRYLFLSRLDAYTYYQQTTGKSQGYSINALQSIESVKSLGLELKLFSRWAGYYTKSLNALQQIGKMDVYAGTVPSFARLLTDILVLCFGAWRVINGSLTIGMLVAMVILMELLTIPMMRLVNFLQLAQYLKIDLARIDDVLTNPIDAVLVAAEKNDDCLRKEFSYAKLKGSLEISNVTFGYDLTGDPILTDINLSIAPGTVVALVGPTGCGKSTLTKLIAGLFEPWKGTILFDNVSRSKLPRSLLTNSIGIAEQDATLFHGTVKENIAFFNPLAEQLEIIRAAKDACIHEDILLRKGGYDLVIYNNGINLSGGQRQRIEIARALAMQPSILILDEATSALDSENEREIMENIRRRGCTCLIIVHKLAAARHCDQIVVLDKGQIVQKGFHEELVASEGLYKKLYALELKKK